MIEEQIKSEITSKKYEFLKNDQHLGNNIIMLAVAGSHAYGTSTKNSDLDIRGCAVNSKEEILSGECFEQVENRETDTVIYSFNKLISLLSQSNPNVIELLGLRDEDYMYVSPIGQELLNSKKLFISKRVATTFGGYANAQLKRIQNKSASYKSEKEALEAKCMQIENGILDLHNEYSNMSDAWENIVFEWINDGNILVSLKFNQMKIQDFYVLNREINKRITDAGKIGQRNKHAMDHNRLGKHMMHLIRLYLTCIEILKTGEIHTYREKEHDFLMNIRNGKYLDENEQPTKEFYKIVDELENEMQKAEEKSDLPDKPDVKSIKQLKMDINERIVNA